MARLACLALCALQAILLVRGEDGGEISAILEQLNSNAEGELEYKEAVVTYAEYKGDAKEVGVSVGFVPKGCSDRCVVERRNCNATFVRNALVEFWCDTSENKEQTSTPETTSEITEEPFVPEHGPCLGCPVEINPNAEGVDDLTLLALKHVESERTNRYAPIKILRVQQQVVAGIKYTLTLSIAPTVCPKTDPNGHRCPLIEGVAPEICQVEFLDQPWISKEKRVIHNNCTSSQEFAEARSVRENEVDGVVRGRENQANLVQERVVDDDWLSELESQVEVEGKREEVPSVRPLRWSAEETTATTDDFERLAGTTTTSPKSDISSEENSNESQETTKALNFSSENNSESSEELKNHSKRKRSLLQNDSSSSEENSKESQEVKKNSAEDSSSSEENRNNKQKRSTTPLEKITPEEKPMVIYLADFAASTLDNIDDDNHKRIVLQILGAKKMKMQGTLYHLTLRIGVSRCFEDERDESCKEKLFENLTKICKVQVHVSEDQFSHRVLKSQCQTIKKDDTDINRTTHNRFRRMVGNARKISKDDKHINELLTSSLAAWDAQSGRENKMKPLEILSATRQIVSGSLYRIKARIAPSNCALNSVLAVAECEVSKEEESKVCDFEIWERVWLNSREVKVNCEGEKQVKLRAKREVNAFDDPDFTQFIQTYGKQYSTNREFRKRLKIFKKNLKFIDLLNRHEMGSAKYGITKFADLTRKEFSKYYLGYRPDLANTNYIPFTQARTPEIELPPQFDWRQKNAVTEVKDQGMCGSCWAFSVTGNVEGQYAIKHGHLQEFSEQELVDCDKLDDGCNGGLMDNAYRAIEKLGGLETEKDYPYDGENERCHFNKSLSRVQITAAVNISHNETDMAKWLVKNGPISIAINANAMQFYVGGVSHPYKFLCNPKDLDHGVLIVGYGIHKYPRFKKELPFWIVKNSWGHSWGEQGYYRVYRGDGTCGLNQTPSSAIVA